MRFIDDTLAGLRGFADIFPGTAYGAFEEAGAAIASINAVMLAGAVIIAHFAWHVIQDAA